MANFIRCKEEYVNYKKIISAEDGFEIKPVLIFFQKVVKKYKKVPETIMYFNTPVNVNMVKTIGKINGLNDKDNTECYSSIEGTEKPGIVFNMDRSSCYWYYSDEQVRDSQFEELLSNNHLYKSRVVL